MTTQYSPEPKKAGLPPAALYRALHDRGYQRFTGVPCSFFSAVIDLMAADGRYVAAANEGAALAIACGSALAGQPSAVLIQNSGLGNLINPLTSLSIPYGVPVLLLVSLRGDPQAPPDEPQHRLMGAATGRLLDAIEVPHWRLPDEEERLGPVMDAAGETIASGRSACLIVGRKTIGPGPAAYGEHGDRCGPRGGERPSPNAVMDAVTSLLTDELVIGTTGYTSRRLFASLDRAGNFYMQGSMGHAISIGLGVALSRPRRRVVILDGDGACLMHLGALATVGAEAPANLTHVILDNGRYESTGGQPSAGRNVAFEEIAGAAGYRWARRVGSLARIPAAMNQALHHTGPCLLVIEVAAGRDAAPPRATHALSPAQIRARFTRQAASSQADGVMTTERNAQ